MHTEVLIVGAGPTGLTLAHELLCQGVQVRLIEKEPTASQNAKALGVWARTLELFARTGTGIVEEMLERGVKIPTLHIWLATNGGSIVTRFDLLTCLLIRRRETSVSHGIVS